MRKFGLIGFPLSHSFSEKYFKNKFEEEEIENTSYDLYPLEDLEDVRLLFEVEKKLQGLNVTIPYKETVIEYLDALDPVAEKIGAVNCIKIDEIHKVGYNTDYLAFRDTIKPLLKPHHKKALILGSGGSSKAIIYALKELNIETKVVSRKKTGTNFVYSELTAEILTEYSIIINCTPKGMFPNSDEAPDLPYQFLNASNLLFDLVYNPEKTLFLQKGEQQGAAIKNGLQMLQLQAEYAWEIWNTEEEEDED